MASRWSMPPSHFRGEPCRSRGWTLNILGRRSSRFAKHHRTLPAHLVGTGGPARGTTDFDFRSRLRPRGVDQGFKARPAAVPHSRSPQRDRLSRERISRAVVFNRTAGFRSLAPHRRSSPAVSATHANRAVFSRLEKPPGAARLAPAGAKIRAPAAGADGIHPRLFDRSAVRGRSVRRKAPPLL